jgi:GT2 family glycosyltransferase
MLMLLNFISFLDYSYGWSASYNGKKNLGFAYGCNHESMSQFVYFVSKDYNPFAKKNFFRERIFQI